MKEDPEVIKRMLKNKYSPKTLQDYVVAYSELQAKVKELEKTSVAKYVSELEGDCEQLRFENDTLKREIAEIRERRIEQHL